MMLSGNAEGRLEAMRQNGFVLMDVSENLKTPELCLEAVRFDGRELQHVPFEMRTAELCLEAVKQNNDALQYVPEELLDEIHEKLSL